MKKIRIITKLTHHLHLGLLALLCGAFGARGESVLISQGWTGPIVADVVIDKPGEPADNFALPSVSAVTKVRWWSLNTGPSFRIQFFADAGGEPAANPFFEETVTPTSQPAPSFVQIFTASLSSPAILQGGTTYYLAIRAEDETDTEQVFSDSSGSDSGFWYRNSDTDPWSPFSFASSKFAFELLGSTDADLSISIGATPNPVRRTQNLTYSIYVLNSGLLTAQNVVLQDVLPSNCTFQSITTQGTAITPHRGATGTVLVHLGDLASGATATVTIVVNVNSKGGTSVINTASVTSDTHDSTTVDNTATISTGIFGSRK